MDYKYIFNKYIFIFYNYSCIRSAPYRHPFQLFSAVLQCTIKNKYNLNIIQSKSNLSSWAAIYVNKLKKYNIR